jgi:hypothetical protein
MDGTADLMEDWVKNLWEIRPELSVTHQAGQSLTLFSDIYLKN